MRPESMVELAKAALTIAAECGHSASKHALKVLLASDGTDRCDATRGEWHEAWGDVDAAN